MLHRIKNYPLSLKLVLIAILITLLFGMALHQFPEIAESLYYARFYVLFRWIWDSIWSWCPIPLIYFWFLFLIGFSLSLFASMVIKKYRTKKLFLCYFTILAFHFILFYWSWGFNYARNSLGDRWNINRPITQSQFLEEFYAQTKLVDSLRIHFKDEIDRFEFKSEFMEFHIRELVLEFHKKYQYKEFKRIRCRDLSIHGILLVWSTSGVYMPFVGESQIDGGLHTLSKPFTMAHELCHNMGWTHEGDCNFLAYQICRMSELPAVRYSAELNYWRYLFSNASRAHREEFEKIKAALGHDVIVDLNAIHKANNRYPEILPKLRALFYDWYLKKHGIPTGDKSYSEIIRMVVHFKSMDGNMHEERPF